MKVLLTGSTGYIGRRLKQKFLNDNNVKLRLYVRNKKSLSSNLSTEVEVVEGDTFDKEKLKLALKDIDVAYYLIHSLNKKNYNKQNNFKPNYSPTTSQLLQESYFCVGHNLALVLW